MVLKTQMPIDELISNLVKEARCDTREWWGLQQISVFCLMGQSAFNFTGYFLPVSLSPMLTKLSFFENYFWLILPFLDSVQFSCSVVSDSLRPLESQHARPPCPPPTPGVHPDSHPSTQWRHPAISSSGVPFSSCPQSLPASGSFPMRQLFAWGGQSIGAN